MIVPSMSHLEICDALFADRPKLQIRARALIPKFSKQFKKERVFPAWKWEEYTHQKSRNRYLISFYAASAEQAGKPTVNFIAFMEEGRQRLVIQWGCWPYRKYGSLDIIMVRAISFYCPHFFQRYRERIWPNIDLSYNDLLCRYFSRNRSNIPIKTNKEIQRNYEEYGDNAYSFQLPDGICFVYQGLEGDELTIGTPEDNVVGVAFFMTIVTHKMMSKIQKDAIERGGKKYILDLYKSLYSDIAKNQLLEIILRTERLRNHEGSHT